MATARDLITKALQELGVLAAGEVATAVEADDGLLALNRLLDAWAAERLQIYTVTRTTWTITPNTDPNQYTVGTGGVVNVARPVFVSDGHVGFVDTSTSPSTEYPLVMLTEAAFAGIPVKGLTSTYPTRFYYNPTYPLASLRLFPVPTSATLTGVLYAPQQVAQLAALTTAVSLPPGYERMLLKNLAIELAPSYERFVSPTLAKQAADAKAIVKRANKRLRDLSIDPGAVVQGRYFPYGYGYDIRLG